MLDMTQLRSIIGEDIHILEELIDAFLHNTPDRLADLRRALIAGDAKSFEHVAHTLKGSSANMGAMRMANLSYRLELAGRNGRLVDVAEQLNQLEAEYEQVKQALEAER
jgi:HPt (histidine-containing phosphotransfer) domain-containing protein